MRYYCCFLIRQFEEINWIYWRDNVLMVIYMFPSVQFLVLIYDYQFDFRGRFSQLLSTLTKILCYGTLSCWCETIRMWQFWWFFHTAKINQREGVACQNYMEALPTNHDDSCKWEIVYRVELKKILTLSHHQGLKTNLVVLSNTILFYF